MMGCSSAPVLRFRSPRHPKHIAVRIESSSQHEQQVAHAVQRADHFGIDRVLVRKSTQTIPEDAIRLCAASAAERAARQAAEIEARDARAQVSGAEAVIAHLKLLIAKLKQEKFGASAEQGRSVSADTFWRALCAGAADGASEFLAWPLQDCSHAAPARVVSEGPAHAVAMARDAAAQACRRLAIAVMETRWSN